MRETGSHIYAASVAMQSTIITQSMAPASLIIVAAKTSTFILLSCLAVRVKLTSTNDCGSNGETPMKRKSRKALRSQIRNYGVSVGMVMGLAFDKGEKIPDGKNLALIIAENLIAHPAWNDPEELAEFIDSIILNDTFPA
jgi:hypothetical protein